MIGQAAFGAGVLGRLLAKGEEIVAVYSPPDSPVGAEDALKSTALDHNVPVLQPLTFKDDRVFADYCGLEPDLAILAFVPRIIPARYLAQPTHDSICFHPSLLPRHRGASAINWALIMGDNKTGLSIFWPDAGIDTGPILLQREVDIGLHDTVGTLYFNHLFPLGIEALIESVELIKTSMAPRIAQNEEEATYEPPCDDQVAGIGWDKPALDIYNLVRGCDPQPGAYAFWEKEKVRFYNAGLIPEDTAEKPGTVVRIDGEDIHVAVEGAKLKIGKIRTESTPKITAADYASKSGIKSGDRFIDIQLQ